MTLPLLTVIGPSVVLTFRSALQWWIGVRTRRYHFPFPENLKETIWSFRKTRNLLGGKVFLTVITPKSRQPKSK
jgi:hypothetical protein